MSYKELRVYQSAEKLVVEIHRMTRENLPKFEMFEIGSQIRRSINSVKASIVEGYGRRQYKKEFIHFLTIAIASNDETISHLDSLYSTGSLQNKKQFETLSQELILLGKMLTNLRKSITYWTDSHPC